MSVSKWRYTEECNGRPCLGDCDHCSFEPADLISRADAVKAIRKCKFDSDMPSDWYRGMECAQDIVEELPSAEAVSMEEHVKELNDLASAWKNKFVNAEKRTEELYDETMGKVANECKTCKERLQNLRPSAEAVQGEWVRKVKEYNDCDGHSFVYWYECDQCGARPPKDQWKNEWHSDYCPNCGARMKGGAE